jgi:hypothetical protein
MASVAAVALVAFEVMYVIADVEAVGDDLARVAVAYWVEAEAEVGSPREASTIVYCLAS